MKELDKNRTKNFNDEEFPKPDITGYYKNLSEKLELNLNDKTKSFDINELYDQKGNKNVFRMKEFLKRFPEFEGKGSSGLYVFGKPNHEGEYIPVYIGISRDLKRRMSEHLLRYDKYNCTWAYLMITKKKKTLEDKEAERQIKKKKEKYFHDLRVTFHFIENNYDMHLTEAMMAVLLRTFWNSFETH